MLAQRKTARTTRKPGLDINCILRLRDKYALKTVKLIELKNNCPKSSI